jgi:F0F1-type ATP synthase membrane subunit b/b'
VVSAPNFSLLLIMACFWVIYFIVKGQLITPLGKILDEREHRRRGAQEDIDATRAAFEAAVSRCEKELADAASAAQKRRAEQRSAGEATRRARLEAARTEGHSRLAALVAEIDRAAEAARQELRARASELSRALVARLLGRRLVS